MTKQEFLERLRTLLACLPADQVDDSVAFYAEAIDDRMEDGMTEAEAVAAMGTPGDAAEAILDELPAVPRAIVKTRRKSNVLLWVLVIVGSPVWVVLALGFAAMALGVYIAIWAIALSVWIVAAALVAMAPVLGTLAVCGGFVGNIPYVVCSAGEALALLGAGLLVGFAAWAVSKQLARLSVLWVKKMLSPFRRDHDERQGARPTPPAVA